MFFVRIANTHLRSLVVLFFCVEILYTGKIMKILASYNLFQLTHYKKSLQNYLFHFFTDSSRPLKLSTFLMILTKVTSSKVTI